jgi:AraC-like DNA-binding protein
MDETLEYKFIKPGNPVSDFVESIWYLFNRSDKAKETTGLPDGLIDIILFKSTAEPFRIVQLGGLTQSEQAAIAPNSQMFCISFKLLAVEYVFHEPIASILNSGRILPKDFWNFNEKDLDDFDLFCEKASQIILSRLPVEIDERKRKLFELIYSCKGAISVKELSEKVFWSSRQINRYFNQQFGLSLKTYCNILRFRASLDHIAKGKLFPEENFADQTHFIKEIKKFSGVIPKELSKNKNDRFILLSAIKQE